MSPRDQDRGSSSPRRGASAKGAAPKQAQAPKKAQAGRTSRPAFVPKPASARPVRLNKFLADRGVDSRRKCDELIVAGKVTVNDEVVSELGTRIDPSQDTVEIAGFVFRPDEVPRKRYYLLNKPPGVVCTNERREQRPRAVDLITDRDKGRIYTVGRLDEESQGLVILTNDGEFAHRIMHPRFEVPKTYAVKVRGHVDEDALAKIRAGVHLSEGRTGGARILVRRRTRDFTHLLVTLREGKNREVRRVFARVGAKVAELERVRIGDLTARGLKTGTWRPLVRAEVQDLIAISEGRDSAAEQGPPSGEARAPQRARSGGDGDDTFGEAAGGQARGLERPRQSRRDALSSERGEGRPVRSNRGNRGASRETGGYGSGAARTSGSGRASSSGRESSSGGRTSIRGGNTGGRPAGGSGQRRGGGRPGGGQRRRSS